MADRAPVFEAIRALLGRGFTQGEVVKVDALLDSLGIPRPAAAPAPGWRLGQLSERYESGGMGPGTISSGRNDPGGVSYGLYQLASATGTAAAFARAEGAKWPALSQAAPGSPAFSSAWADIAKREPAAFAEAQHAFIERTHYRPVVADVLAATGRNLDAAPAAVRDAVWSTAVQHGRAAQILANAVRAVSTGGPADLINAIYDARTAYVRGLLGKASAGAAKTYRNLIEGRYPDERRRALEALP